MVSNLQIVHKSLLRGAFEVEGIVVVIDVLRAFTSAAFLMYLGVEKILLLTDPEEVLTISREKGYVSVGEVGGKKVEGFDFGNSPSKILSAGSSFFEGKTVAFRSTAGVAGAVTASGLADMVILGSYVTAKAVSQFILQSIPFPNMITLLAMGDGDKTSTPEDEACGYYLEHLLTGVPYDHLLAIQRTFSHESTQIYLQGDQENFPRSDITFCFQRDLFDFVLVAEEEEGYLVARKRSIR